MKELKKDKRLHDTINTLLWIVLMLLVMSMWVQGHYSKTEIIYNCSNMMGGIYG